MLINRRMDKFWYSHNVIFTAMGMNKLQLHTKIGVNLTDPNSQVNCKNRQSECDGIISQGPLLDGVGTGGGMRRFLKSW